MRFVIPFLFFLALDSTSTTNANHFDGSGIRILDAKNDCDNPEFRAAISEITGGQTDHFQLKESDTPSLAELNQYHCVMVHDLSTSDSAPEFGDALADYVDGGGVVVLSERASSGGPGRIWQPGYSPIIHTTEIQEIVQYGGDGITDIFHQVTAFDSNLYHNDPVLQGDGIADGTYANGTIIAAAYRPDFRVVYLNLYCSGGCADEEGYPDFRHCPAQTATLWTNACSIAGVEGPARTNVPTDTIPTEPPSTTPSTSPTVATASPTSGPTSGPTVEPTPNPTREPTPNPTREPTPDSTPEPTETPEESGSKKTKEGLLVAVLSALYVIFNLF